MYLSAPGLVSLLLTNRCNLKCFHCISASGEPLEAELSYEELLHVIDQCGRMNVFFVDFNGGEPFTHSRLGSLVKTAHGHGIRCVITTNGTLLTPQWLKEYGRYVFMFRISVDSHDPEDHDDFRGVSGCWEKTVKAIQTARQNGNRVTMLTCVQRKNLHHLDKIYNLAHRLDCNAYKIILLLAHGRGEQLASWVLKPEEIRDLCLRLQELRATARRENRRTVIMEECPQSVLVDKNIRRSGAERTCGAAVFEMAVTPNGTVLPCSSYIGMTLDQTLSIRTDSLREIWKHSDLFRTVRSRADIESPCSNCSYFKSCFGGCRAAAYHWKTSHTAADPTCWL